MKEEQWNMKARKGIIAVASTETFFIMVLSSNTKVLGFMSIIKIYSYSLSVSHHFFNVNVMGKEAGN